jgi:hypothetical protein
MFEGIKVIKLFAFESTFITKVVEIRTQELSMLRKLLFLKEFNNFLSFVIPVLMTVATFAMFVFINDKEQLTASVAFTVLALFATFR